MNNEKIYKVIEVDKTNTTTATSDLSAIEARAKVDDEMEAPTKE